MAILADFQYELTDDNGVSVVFGRDTFYPELALEFDELEIETRDQRRPRADGISFGKDFFTGQVWSFEMGVLVKYGQQRAQQVLELLEDLRDVWPPDAVRSTPGATLRLRYKRPGRPTRCVIGRPRLFSPVLGSTTQGWVPLVATFQTRDQLFYGDDLRGETLTLDAPDSLGLVEPLVEPLSTAPITSFNRFVTQFGGRPAPMVVRFHGPSTAPSLTLGGGSDLTIAYPGTIAFQSFVEVDTFRRTALRDGVAGVALTRASRFFGLPPGTSELLYQASDPTGQSRVEVEWRDAHTSL